MDVFLHLNKKIIFKKKDTTCSSNCIEVSKYISIIHAVGEKAYKIRKMVIIQFMVRIIDIKLTLSYAMWQDYLTFE